MRQARRPKNSTVLFVLHFAAWLCVRPAESQCESTAVPCPSDCNLSPICCFSMPEEEPINQTVGNVNVVSVINEVLINNSGSISHNIGQPDFFELEPSTGAVRVAVRVDRDGPGANTCLTIGIRVGGGLAGSTLLTVGVIVEDINDNAPVFNQAPDTYRREEGLNMSLCIGAWPGLEAVDSDTGQNGEIRYNLEGEGAEKFDIDNNCIVNTAELDREAMADPSSSPEYHIQLTVTAADSTAPYHETNTTLTIVVTDTNDNPPAFTEPSLDRVQVREDTVDGVVIRELNATDRDYNNTLRFTLETNGVPFAIDAVTGNLSVDTSENRALTTGTRALTVAVSDMGGLTNRSTLTVDILDVNDKAELNFIKETTLVEEMTSNEFLIRYQIIDKDIVGSNSYDVELSGLHTENFTGNFQIVQNGFRVIDITLTHPVDQELIRDAKGQSTIELHVLVTERGPFANHTHNQTRIIPVVGINDNLPFLNETEFIAREEEELQMKDLVFIDLDSGENGSIASWCVISALSFTNSSIHVTAKFKNLNPCSNTTTLTVPSLDREADTDIITVTMELTDGGGLSNRVNITITLTDVNDNCPNFDEDIPVIRFDEGTYDSFQGSVHATDDDIGSNAEVKYVLMNHNNLFSIDALTGGVNATGSFDREVTDTYLLQIIAMDSNQIGQGCDEWDKTELTIQILDLNDNPPVWENRATTYDVFSDSPIKQFVTTLTATDSDLDATITYSIEPNNLFVISHSGIITVAADLSDKLGSHNLRVTASDGKHMTPRNITIEVKTPDTATSISPVVIGVTIGLCVLLVGAIMVVTVVVLYCVFLDKRRRSVKLSKRNGRSEVDGISSPARGILRQIPSSAISGLNGRSSSASGTSRGVKFEKTVQKIGYDYENSTSDVYVTQSAIHLDSSGDESPVTPPRMPTAASHHHHHNGKLPTLDSHHPHANGGPRLPPIHEDFLFAPHSMHRSHPMQDEYSDDSEGNSEDDESTLPDNASSTNAPLPNTRHLSHIASSPRSTPPNSHLGPHLPMAQISPSHPYTRSPDHTAGLNPPHHEELSVHSSSSESLTASPPPVHSHLSHENQRLGRPPGRCAYPTHMPEGYVLPPSSSSRYGADPFMGRYGGTDFGDASTYTSVDLDAALHFNPDQEPGIFSLTATSSYDEESQL